jgi:hypothetical protein
MNRKNLLLVVFFLTLFVFQQVQAGRVLPSSGRLSEMNMPLANTFLFGDVYVQIYPLIDGRIVPGSSACTLPNTGGGCPDADPPTWCKTGSANQDPTYKFYYLCTDQDYLPDVLAGEMDLVDIYPPELEALKAQAVAARTFASYKSKNFGVNPPGTAFLLSIIPPTFNYIPLIVAVVPAMILK